VGGPANARTDVVGGGQPSRELGELGRRFRCTARPGSHGGVLEQLPDSFIRSIGRERQVAGTFFRVGSDVGQDPMRAPALLG
jgi:hypothetical protein